MKTPLLTLWLATLICSLITHVTASSGDRLSHFNICLKKCSKGCPEDFLPIRTLPLYLTLWTCIDNCKYECMHTIIRHSIESNEKVHQFYGKWPFYRFLGMQEPASVLFSIGNGYMHYKGAQKYLRFIGPRFSLRPIILVYAFASINTWIWSAVFHTRDLPLTEKLDYFSAMLGLLIALFYGIHRVFNVKLESLISSLTAMIFGAFFLTHISYLSFFRFDYGYNMKASITVAILHNIIWLYWCFANRKTVPHAWKMGVIVLILVSTVLLEIFDFPPYFGIFDAHSLFHASTIPCVKMYWEFLLLDSKYLLSNNLKND